MSNTEIHKGKKRLLGVDFQSYDGTPDITTAMTVNVTPAAALVVTPGPSNREVYVSVPPSATAGVVGITVDMKCTLPGPSGVAAAEKFVRYFIDSIVPPDLRGATSRPIGAEELE